MFRFGTPNSSSALRVMMLGCGELGKEVVISLQRLGCEVIDHTLDGDVLWTVVRVTARQAGVMGLAAGESVCYIGCHLLESSGGDWGYKSLDESVHPYYYSCPLRYLDMAPVQSSEWRERVHRFHAGRTV